MNRSLKSGSSSPPLTGATTLKCLVVNMTNVPARHGQSHNHNKYCSGLRIKSRPIDVLEIDIREVKWVDERLEILSIALPWCQP